MSVNWSKVWAAMIAEREGGNDSVMRWIGDRRDDPKEDDS
jgi:hypothetical protein